MATKCYTSPFNFSAIAAQLQIINKFDNNSYVMIYEEPFVFYGDIIIS